MSLIMPDGSRTVAMPPGDPGFPYEPPMGGRRPATAAEQMQLRRRDLRAALAQNPGDPRLRAQWEEFQKDPYGSDPRTEKSSGRKGLGYAQAADGTPVHFERTGNPLADVGRGRAVLEQYRQSRQPVNPFLKSENGFNLTPNPAFGQTHGLEWDGKQWVKANPNADLEREAAQMALDMRRWEFDQMRREREEEGRQGPRPAESDIRTLMQEARRAMAEQRQQQAAGEQIARELSDEDISSSGRPWRWDGNQMQYTDTEAERVRLARQKRQVMDQDQVNAGRRARAAKTEARNSAERALNAEREQRQKTGESGPLMKEFARANAAGRAQPVQPQDTGTPYGEIDFEAMYWDLVASGLPPEEAQERVREALAQAQRLKNNISYDRRGGENDMLRRARQLQNSPDYDSWRATKPKGFVDMGRIVG